MSNLLGDHDTARCFRHGSVETALFCQRCERPICTTCATHGHVGIHCPECREGRPVRRFGVRKRLLVAVILAVLAAGVGGALLLNPDVQQFSKSGAGGRPKGDEIQNYLADLQDAAVFVEDCSGSRCKPLKGVRDDIEGSLALLESNQLATAPGFTRVLAGAHEAQAAVREIHPSDDSLAQVHHSVVLSTDDFAQALQLFAESVDASPYGTPTPSAVAKTQSRLHRAMREYDQFYSGLESVAADRGYDLDPGPLSNS
jgi:hypothetical protein